MKPITRNDYMNNSSELHHAFYSQFVTKGTNNYILNSLTVDEIKKALDSGDEHLNKIKIPFNNMGSGGNWWWDFAPINLKLAQELGAVSKGCYPSHSTITCIAKAAARILTENL
tara:strand:- start:134 stop:475 length:342 start_codon:yes stop_codon:yes gene_type:complete